MARKAEFPYLADWFAISLRWLGLMWAVVALARAESLNAVSIIPLIGAVAWNIFMSLMAIFNQRISGHRILNVLVDTLISLLLFLAAGGYQGPMGWAGILAVFSSSIYFEWSGSLLIALLFPLLEGGWAYFKQPELASPLTFGLMLAGYLVIGIVMGAASRVLMKNLRSVYMNKIRRKKETERTLQQQERKQVQAFYRSIEEISATLNYQVVIDEILNLSTQILGGEDTASSELISAVLLFDGQNLKTQSARRLPPRDIKITFPAESGALKLAIENGEPQSIANPAEDPELRNLVILQDCKSGLVLPLLRGLNAYGIILYAHPQENFFTPGTLELLEMLSHQAVVAIQNARLYQEVQEEKERIIESQEETRKKLARDLHDGPTQSVSAIAMRINVVRKMLELKTGDPEGELEKIEDLARRTTKEIRHMLFTLRPLALESAGLTAALEAMAEKMEQTYQQKVQVEVDENVINRLEIGKQTVVFFITEEAVNNARKHAQASLIMIRLRFQKNEPDIALLEVMDNGKGFDLEAVTQNYEQRGSLGMINLQERTDLVNGLLKINSIPEKGTRILVQIPLNEAAADRLHRGLITPN